VSHQPGPLFPVCFILQLLREFCSFPALVAELCPINLPQLEVAQQLTDELAISTKHVEELRLLVSLLASRRHQ